MCFVDVKKSKLTEESKYWKLCFCTCTWNIYINTHPYPQTLISTYRHTDGYLIFFSFQYWLFLQVCNALLHLQKLYKVGGNETLCSLPKHLKSPSGVSYRTIHKKKIGNPVVPDFMRHNRICAQMLKAAETLLFLQATHSYLRMLVIVQLAL